MVALLSAELLPKVMLNLSLVSSFFSLRPLEASSTMPWKLRLRMMLTTPATASEP